MAKGIENRARSPPAVFDFATSQIQKHGGTKMYYDLVESGKRIKALRKEHGLTQEQLAEQLGVAANTIARIETGNRGISIDLAIELVVRFETTLDYIFLGREFSISALRFKASLWVCQVSHFCLVSPFSST